MGMLGSGFNEMATTIQTQEVGAEHLYAELEARDAVRRQLLGRLTTAHEEERRYLARELHDELGQSLTALKIDLAWIHERMGSDPEAELKVASMQGLLDSTVAAARRISSDLRPLMLDDLGLVAACDWLVQSFRGRTGKPCIFEMRGDLDLADPHATAVFRVLQESLTNVARHAEASRVEVTLERARGKVTLLVKDDGRGLTGDSSEKSSSYGIVGMRERAYVLGGTATIESVPGGGTAVRLELPEPGTAK